MNRKLLSIVIGLLTLLVAPSAFVMADNVSPDLCIPTVNILYNDFDEVIAQVFIPTDCPIAGDGTLNPSEVLESMVVHLQRKSVEPGGSVSTTPITHVASAVVDVTTITTVHNAGLLRKDVWFSITPSYTTTDYHRVIVEVHGSQGADDFATRAASIWLSMAPPPQEIGGFAPVPPSGGRTTFDALAQSSGAGTRGGN